ncbi:haloacid dehalogenase superfamily, subfamily IA, variant 3 with third motif having DD or ED [Enhydrobacter aerosaccus]|uniref:Haloacid dehalogenase superfamily, subfamily IA, variant 3 with third motif having DD or ED n=1 Tax=Enhydrobacter aerosaccus TaxID=225324 RepID=A0A1T4T5A0_9HYPH|nr:HAD family hydrolase [Enhydrobacter aerosaccus]SKA35622.1 haloacid dehalogenase superfamily, subfamily IA, variant 3 with third motif having DD or ED [Enhydrobacter aerosaccus]
MRRPDLLIFDCDGVLVDSEILEHDVDAELLTRFGLTVTTRQLIERFVGIARADMYRTLFEEIGQPQPAGLLDEREAMVWARCDVDLSAVAGVGAALDALSHIPKCVASSSIPAKLTRKLDAVGLTAHFAPHIFSTAIVPRGKPAPDIYLHAARIAGATPSRCIVIEDSPHGVRGAKAAGMSAIGFCGAGHATDRLPAELEAAGADLVVMSMDELPAAIRSHCV